MALTEVPRPALTLGVVGLFPFLIGATGSWLLPDPYNFLAAQAGLVYAPVIVTFLGAVHWGYAMADGKSAMSFARLGFSILPALVSWVALLSHPTPALILMAACFSALYLADVRAIQTGRFPAWYKDLRRPLTIVVLLCLLSLLIFSLRMNA